MDRHRVIERPERLQNRGENNSKKVLIPHPPAITTEVEEKFSAITYKTTQLRKDRYKRGYNSKFIASQEKNDEDLPVLTRYSTSAAKNRKRETDLQRRDPVLAYITAQRSKLHLDTIPNGNPEEEVRDSLVATSGPIAGIKDLKLLSRKLLELQGGGKEQNSVSDFVYAIRESGDGKCVINPYNICIVASEIARRHDVYYTISPFCVAEVKKKGGLTPTHVLKWLWERDIFNKIISIPFFKRFKIWRVFIRWRRGICRRKFLNHRQFLRTNLFSADVLFQKTILEVQGLCETASSVSEDDYLYSKRQKSDIALISFKDKTLPLDEFMSLQLSRCDQAKEELVLLREKIITVVYDTLKTIARNEGMLEFCDDNILHEEPSHTQVLEWRLVLEKMKRFEQLCSNFILQLMQRLVMKAISTLEHGAMRVIGEATSNFEKQIEDFSKMRNEVGSQPFTQAILDRLEYHDPDNIDEELLELQASSFSTLLSNVDLDSFLLTDQLSEQTLLSLSDTQHREPLDFIASILSNASKPIVPIWAVQLELLMDTKKPSDSTNKPQVQITPSPKDFQKAIKQLLDKYSKVISSFSPISKDSRIEPFMGRSKYDLLMIMDDQQEASWNHSEYDWPDVLSLMYNYTPFKDSLAYINKSVTLSMSDIKKLSSNYQCYGDMIEKCKNVSISASIKSMEWTVATFQRAFALYHDQVHAINSMVTSFLAGVICVEGNSFKEYCLTFPKNILKELEYEFPKLVAEKADRLISNIKASTDRMLITPSNVESFVSFLANVDQIEASIPDMEKKLTTITSLYNVAQQFEVSIRDVEMALYKSLFPQFRHLKNALMQAQATKSESVHQFSSNIRSQMVALLNRAMELKASSESQSLLDESLTTSSKRPVEELTALKSELDSLIVQSKKFVQYHHLFSKIPTSKKNYHSLDNSSQSWTPEEVYDEILGVQQALATRKTLFETKANWDKSMAIWVSTPLLSLEVSKVQKTVNGYIKTIDNLEKNLPCSNKLLQCLHNDAVQFRIQLPTLSCLLNPALKFRHWDSITNQTGGKLLLRKGSDITFNDLEDMEIFEHSASIAMVSNQANHEETLENMLKKIAGEWDTKEFRFTPYRGLTERLTYILGDAEEVFSSIEDSLTILGIIKNSRYVGPIKHAVLDWDSRLVLALETMEFWMLCQKNWLYLENIFTAVDMQRRLSTETGVFLQADKSWREAVRLITEKKTALKAVTTPGILEAFQACNVLLEQVFKNLEDYLEAKRLVFPRLNFISNSELLDILSHSKDFTSVQPYLSKIFGNIKRLELSKSRHVSPPIIAMVSAEDERIEITRKCIARGSPEEWLSNFEHVMLATVNDLMKLGMAEHSQKAELKWIQEHPGQIILTVNQIKWTEDVISCIGNELSCDSLQTLHYRYVESLASTATLLNEESLLPAQRCAIASLLTLNVHNRDIVHMLSSGGITSVEDFEWQRHLRYYWDGDTGTCSLHQCSGTFKYGNEYLGCLPRLVITPLSERCYLTLTTAMHLHLGASPIGPAGTGKSETVKDLAKAMGQLCLIINCSEGLDCKMMGRYFSGLCQSGIWCCFDEFNRINVEVLSVLAQQLKSIKTAKDQQNTSFIFEGRSIKLVSSCAVFITMNPGYTGRVELPDNLKSFFRPIAMMVPDTNMIAEVLLFTHCFTTAPILALKLTKFYEIIKAQISSQHHYDFGLRSIKAVIILAGKYLKKISSNGDGEACRFTVEKEALVSALRNATLPRLVAKDVPAINMLLWDLFHVDINCESENQDESKLRECIRAAMKESSLEPSSSQVQKCLELYNILLVRHGVMLLGPTGGGKTTVIKLLMSALNSCYTSCYGTKSFHGVTLEASSMLSVRSVSQAIQSKSQHCQLEIINPKSVSVGTLYGHSDQFTLEWKNGILARILLTFCNQTESELNLIEEKAKKSEQKREKVVDGDSRETSLSSLLPAASSTSFESPPPRSGLCYPPCAPVGWRWTLMDGPVDSEWIENLNSVLDDSKVLCLSNGERISLLPGSRMLFESDSLTNASPATVSRCGMIFLDPSVLGWKPLILSWIKTLPNDIPNEVKNHLLKLFDQSIDIGLDFLKQHSSELSCPAPGISVVNTLCHLLYGLLKSISDDYGGFKSGEPATDELGVDEGSSDDLKQTLAGIYIPSKHQNKSRSNKPVHHENSSYLYALISNLYVFAYTWSFGGCFERIEEELNLDMYEDDTFPNMIEQKLVRGGATAREKFDALVHSIFTKGEVVVQLPTSTNLIYSYYVDINTNSFEPWKKLISTPLQNVSFLSSNENSPFVSQRLMFKLFINPVEEFYSASSVSLLPTVDIIRLSFLVSVLFESNSVPNTLISGQSGVGKTQFLSYLSKALTSRKWRKSVMSSVLGNPRLRPSSTSLSGVGGDADHHTGGGDDHAFASVLYRVQTRPDTPGIQSVLEKYLVRKGKMTLAPSSRDFLVCLDDMNTASCDSHGYKPSLEVLRQVIGNGGWYDRKTLLWKEVVGLKFIATLRAGGTNATSVSERLLSQFCLFDLPEASSQSLLNVYSTHILRSFNANKFAQDVLDCIPKLTSCGIIVLHEARRKLIPSPMKPQYTFCLKDLSKVFTGLLRLDSKGVSTKEEVTRLLINELARVFYDRCLPEDRDKSLQIISEGLRIALKTAQSCSQLKEQLTELPFADFIDTLKGYSVLKSNKKLVKYLERTQDELSLKKDSHLVFFPLACEHIIRMVRILQLPRGHILLIGLGGVGRRSCVHLAAQIASMSYHCLAPVHAPFSDFLDDIRAVLRECGTENHPTVVLATSNIAGEHQDSFFGVMNELVVGGEILDMFEKDEVEGMIYRLAEEITENVDSEVSTNSIKELREILTKRITRNLNVVICFTPSSSELSGAYRKYPGLVTHTTVDVFDEWPAKALYSVAMKEIQLEESKQAGTGVLSKDQYSQVATICVKIHGTVLSAVQKSAETSQLSFVVTPSTFIHFIRTFIELLEQQNDKVTMKRIHLELGVSRLSDADENVTEMKGKLQQLQPQVLQKSKEVDSLLSQLAGEQEIMDSLKESVLRERQDIAMETNHVTSLAKEAEEDLRAVLPVLKAAERELNSLKKSDLIEIRTYSTPPSMVKYVMSAVCVLLKEPTNWASIKRIMTDPFAFLRRLTSLDKDEVPDAVLSKLKKYTKDPNFNSQKMSRYSVACQSFCKWVLAIEHYSNVYSVVKPKRELHSRLSVELQEVMGMLQSKEIQLKELTSEMKTLADKCALKTRERDDLDEKYKEIKRNLTQAEVLMQCLDDEQVRWKDTLSVLKSHNVTFLGDTILMSSCFAYFGPFVPSLRQSLLAKWKHLCHESKIPCHTQFTLESSREDSEKIQEWYTQGLPKDSQSVQNAVILTATNKTPFIIDPQSQAVKWLKTMLADSFLMVLDHDNSKLVQYLEHAATAGLPLMITGVSERLSPILDPFLRKRSRTEDNQQHVIKVGKTEIKYNPSFRLFLVNSSSIAKLSSNTCTKTKVINFSATLLGYQDQLLSATIKIKEPTLESQYDDLLLSISEDKKQLERLEEKLLASLNSSAGQLLDDKQLSETLSEVTNTAAEVKYRLQKAFETKETITASRLEYEQVAARGSILFFTLLSLHSLDPVYVYSSDWFMEVYKTCIDSVRAPSTDRQTLSFGMYLNEIIEHLTLTVYHRVTNGILTKHCLPFAFKLCTMLLMHGDKSLKSSTSITNAEWLALLRDAPQETEPNVELIRTKKLKPETIHHEIWENAVKLEKALPLFSGLLRHIINNTEEWIQFSESNTPWNFNFESENVATIPASSTIKSKRKPSSSIPFAFSGINRFQLLLLINAFCSENLASSAKWFIESELGLVYTIKSPCDLKTVYPYTNNVNPALIIIAPNVDPTAQLILLADEMSQSLESISLGQGQEKKATSSVGSAAKNGRWIFLQNCHLASSWMPQLEVMLKDLQASSEVHSDFRLWLSSKSTTTLPSVLLQSSVKISLETPVSVKSNMQQLISVGGTSTLSYRDFELGYIPQWQDLVFKLCLFHSVANARRGYGSEGWNIPYVFGPTDLQVSIQLLHNILRDQDNGVLSCSTIYHLVGEICYGGKITDTEDMNALRALLRKYCSQQTDVVTPGLSYEEASELVNKLPHEDDPNTLGLSPVLKYTMEKKESRHLLSTLCLLETVEGLKSYGERKKDDIVLERASELLEQLPSILTPFNPCIKDSTPMFPGMKWKVVSPFWLLLSSEILVLNEKLSSLSSSLKIVVRGIKGEVVHNLDFWHIYKAIADNTAPDSWKFGRDAPCLLPDWMKWFSKNYTFIVKWMSMNASDISSLNFDSSPKLPSIVSLPSLSYIKGYFEAMKQSYSRRADLPIENIIIRFDDTHRFNQEEEVDGVIVSGLRIGRAEWDQDRGLVRSFHTENYIMMPNMGCYPLDKTLDIKSRDSWYYCPLYTSSTKEMFVCYVALRTRERPEDLNLNCVTIIL